MARDTDATAGRQRTLSLIAVAALAGATGLAFGRVFVGSAPTRALVVAGLASVAIAAVFERRALVLALLASAIGFALAVTWILLPQTGWYGLPSVRTLRAVGRSLDFVGQQARVQIAPTPPFPPLLLAALSAIWTAAFSTHALAIRAGSPLLATLPSVALVGFADTVLEDGTRPLYAIAFLLAVLAVIFADGLRRVREWGPVWSPGQSRRRPSVTSRAARRVAFVAVLAAVLAPGLLPGFHSGALVDFSTTGDDGIELDPFVSIQNRLGEREPVDLFEVRSEEGAAYWRLYALDSFDGVAWTSSDPRAAQGQVIDSPAQLPTRVPPTSGALHQQYTVLRDLNDPWLPMAYPAEAVTVPFDSIRYDADLATAVADGGLGAGLEYSVTSRVIAPTARELRLVRFGPPADYGRYTSLPGAMDPRIRQIAQQWTRGAGTPFEQIKAIQDRFRGGTFLYTVDVEPVADSDALANFLVNTHRGFCQQFATAMAVLVRELGYPARVAVGFQPGEQRGVTYTVRSKDAHAWVEVFFPGYGWLPFEPTPTRSNPLGRPGTYLNPGFTGAPPSLFGGEGRELGRAGGAGAQTNCAGVPGQRQLCNSDPQVSRRGPQAGSGRLPPGFLPSQGAPVSGGYSIPYRWIALGLGVSAILLLVFVPIAKSAWRRRMLRRSRPPRELVLAAYRVFDGEAADLGLGRRDGETLAEHRVRLSASARLSDGHLASLASTASRAAYASEHPSAEEARQAVRDARTAIADLRRDAGMVRRVIGTYRPGL